MSQKSSRVTAIGNGAAPCGVVRHEKPGRQVVCFLVEDVALALPGIRVESSDGEKNPALSSCASWYASRSLSAVMSGRASWSQDPRFAREREIGGELEHASGATGGLDREGDADRVGACGQRRMRGSRAPGHGVGVEGIYTPVDRDVGVDVDDALDRVIPGIALESAVGLEHAFEDAVALGGARERLRLGRLGFVFHPERIGADGLALRGLAPVVDIGAPGAPGPELGRRRRDVDAGVRGPLPVFEPRARVGVGGHGAVDGEPRGVAHLVEERGLDGFLARRQHEFEVGAVLDVGRDRPLRAVHGLDRRQADADRESVEVDVGVVEAEARPAVLEHAEHESPPALGMQRPVEEGAALDQLAFGRGVRRVLEDDRQRVVPGGCADGVTDGIGVLGVGRPERDGWCRGARAPCRRF